MRRSFVSALFLLLVIGLNAQHLIYSDTIPTEQIRLSPNHAIGGFAGELLSDFAYFLLEIKGKTDIVGYITDVCQNGGHIAIIATRGGTAGGISHVVHLYKTTGHLVKVISLEDMSLGMDRTVNSIQAFGDGFALRTAQYRIKITKTGGYSIRHYNEFVSLADDSVVMENATWYYTSPRNRSKEALKNDQSVEVWYASNTVPKVYLDIKQHLSPYHGDNRVAYATFSYNYKVFEMNKKQIQKIYDFILPISNTLDTSSYNQLQNWNDLKPYINKNPKVVLGFNSVFRYKKYLFLELKELKGGSIWLAYNLNSKEVINLKNIVPDSSNHFMLVIGWQNYLTTDGEYLYSLIYPNEVEVAVKNSKLSNDPIKKSINVLRNSKNPILVRFKIKV